MSTTQTINVADKVTLDSVNSKVTNIVATPAIKYDATAGETKVYDPVNEEYVTMQTGGGGTSSLIITNPNHALDNTNITVVSQNYLFTTTKNMGTNDYIIVELPWLGIYYVAMEEGVQLANVETCGGVLLEAATSYLNFSSCSNKELQAMLDMHYNNLIDLSTIWSVGDTRKISLSPFSAPFPSVGQTWSAQDIAITILDFNHTDLATPINGHTKAALTLQTREVLSSSTNTVGSFYVNGDDSYDMSFNKWSDLYMRTYLNNKVYNAFPSEIKSAIKPSKHYRHTNYNTSSSEEVTDNLFLPSYPEIFGTASYDYYVATDPVEGTQFKYYETAANRIKYTNSNGSKGSTKQNWWEGSASSYYDSSNGYAWCNVNTSGSATANVGSNARGLAPAFAM